MYYIHKQLIPTDTNQSDPNWAKRQIWVLKLNPNDSIDSFENLEDAEIAKNELQSSDPSGRVYKIVLKNEDGTYSDI
jgi:hypothetical protein